MASLTIHPEMLFWPGDGPILCLSRGSRHAKAVQPIPSRAEPSRAELSRAELSQAEPSRAEPSRAEPSRARPSRAELSRAESGRAGRVMVDFTDTACGEGAGYGKDFTDAADVEGAATVARGLR